MSGMQDVEASIGEDDALALGSQLGSHRNGSLPVQDLARLALAEQAQQLVA